MPFGGGLLAGAGIVSNIIGGIAGQQAGAGDRAAGTNAVNASYQKLLEAGLPPDEAKPIIYNQFKQAGILTPELEQTINQGPSQMAGVSGSQPAQNAQLQALQTLQQRGQTGLTPEDQAALNQVRQQVSADTNAKQQAVQQQFAARGEGGSGAELIGKLQAAQSGANQESQSGNQVAAMASQNALQAIGQAGTLGGQIQQQQFGEQAQKAQAQDIINQFNTQNQIGQQARNVGAQNQAQAGNLSTAQNLSNANTQQSNQELLRQNQAQRQQYLDTLNQVTGQNQAAQGYNSSMQAAGAQAASQAAAPWTALGAGASTVGTGMMKSNSQQPQYQSGFSEGGEVGHYDDGGDVDSPSLWDKIKNSVSSNDSPYNKYATNSQPASLPPSDVQLAKQESLRKAFNFADGGDVPDAPAEDPEISRLRKIFPSMSDDNLKDLHNRASNPEKYVQPSNAQPGYMSPQGSASPLDANPYVNTARILAQGHSDGGGVTSPSLHQRRMPVTDYRGGGHVPGKAQVMGNSPKNDTVPAMLSPGEFVVKRTDAKSPFGKKLIKLLEAHHDVMKHDKG